MSKPKAPRSTKPVIRDDHGHFLPGSGPNSPGRPPRAIEDQYLQTLRATVTPEQWKAICERAVADALQGTDTPARVAALKWLAKYLLPAPQHNVNIGGTLADLLAALADRPDQALDG